MECPRLTSERLSTAVLCTASLEELGDTVPPLDVRKHMERLPTDPPKDEKVDDKKDEVKAEADILVVKPLDPSAAGEDGGYWPPASIPAARGTTYGSVRSGTTTGSTWCRGGRRGAVPSRRSSRRRWSRPG